MVRRPREAARHRLEEGRHRHRRPTAVQCRRLLHREVEEPRHKIALARNRSGRPHRREQGKHRSVRAQNRSGRPQRREQGKRRHGEHERRNRKSEISSRDKSEMLGRDESKITSGNVIERPGRDVRESRVSKVKGSKVEVVADARDKGGVVAPLFQIRMKS